MLKNTENRGVTMPRLIRRPELLSIVGLSRSSLYEQISDGTFPRPIQIGAAQSVAWLESEILEWIEHRISLRDRGRKPTSTDLQI